MLKIPQTKRLQIANLMNLFARLTLEVFFIAFGSYLFNIKVYYDLQMIFKICNHTFDRMVDDKQQQVY